VGISLEKAGLGVFFKIFLCLYAAVAVALANFFLRPIDAGRLALPAAAYFGIVANSFVVNSILPPSHSFGLVDIVTSFGLGTVFITVARALLVNHLYSIRGEAEVALCLDQLLFFAATVGCIAANIAIPVCIYHG
jgi:hypothetical protein